MSDSQPGAVAPGAAAPILYSPPQIFAACLLGTPLAAGWLLSRNFRALRDEKEARSTIMRSTVATAVVFGIASFLPLKTFSLVWPLVYSFLVAGYASKVFGISLQRPTRSGSWSLALGAGIVGAAALISALLLLAWILRR